MTILQVQSISGTWREVGSCTDDPTIIAKRLDVLVGQYKKQVRAINGKTKALIDMRFA
jgi:hypothetical protein